MNFPDDLYYTKEHEWIRIDSNVATVGITDHAQDALGDIVFLELPVEGGPVNKGEAFGTVESVKAVSEIYAPLSGSLLEVNEPLTEHPETVNEDPYGEGWMIRIEISHPEEVDELLSVEEYKAFLEEEK